MLYILKPKAAVSPPTRFLKAILKCQKVELLVIFPSSLRGGGCVIESKRLSAHYLLNMH